MLSLLAQINQLVASAIPEAYLTINPQTDVVYPYAVYNCTVDNVDFNQDELSLSIDVFDDQGLSAVRIEQTCWKIKKTIAQKVILSDDFLAQIFFTRQNTIPTGSTILQRRNMDFNIKIDWRK